MKSHSRAQSGLAFTGLIFSSKEIFTFDKRETKKKKLTKSTILNKFIGSGN